MELAEYKPNELVPIIELDDVALNTVILAPGGLGDFLVKYLQVKDTPENQERLELVLPLIKEFARRMTLKDIKLAVMYYVKGELSIEPVDNYLTPILFGKIISAYNQEKRVHKKKEYQMPKVSEEEKQRLIKQGVKSAFDSVHNDGYIPEGYLWVYDHLFRDMKLYRPTKKEVLSAEGIAESQMIQAAKMQGLKEYNELKSKIANAKEWSESQPNPLTRHKDDPRTRATKIKILERWMHKQKWEEIESKL